MALCPGDQARDGGELQLLPLDEADAEVVLALITKHAEETGSELADRLLADPVATLGRFTKVLPREYAAVQGIREEARTQGQDPDGDEAWHKILEVTTRG